MGGSSGPSAYEREQQKRQQRQRSAQLWLIGKLAPASRQKRLLAAQL